MINLTVFQINKFFIRRKTSDRALHLQLENKKRNLTMKTKNVTIGLLLIAATLGQLSLVHAGIERFFSPHQNFYDLVNGKYKIDSQGYCGITDILEAEKNNSDGFMGSIFIRGGIRSFHSLGRDLLYGNPAALYVDLNYRAGQGLRFNFGIPAPSQNYWGPTNGLYYDKHTGSNGELTITNLNISMAETLETSTITSLGSEQTFDKAGKLIVNKSEYLEVHVINKAEYLKAGKPLKIKIVQTEIDLKTREFKKNHSCEMVKVSNNVDSSYF